MSYKHLEIEKQDGIVTLSLNRPEKLNALSIELCDELAAALDEIAGDTGARVLVVTGKGKSFSAGGDFNSMREIAGDAIKTDNLLRKFPKISLSLRNLDVPVVAKINGDAYGGGFCLALACDLRITVNTAKFGFVFFRAGLSGADFGATYYLPRLVGVARAFEILSLSRTIEAKEAAELGLVNFCASPESLDEETGKIVSQLAAAPPYAMKMTKRALYFGLDRDIESDFNFECYVQDLCFQTRDHKEGVRAILEKRQPVFTGE